MNQWVVFDRSTADAAQDPDREIELRSNGSVAEALNQAVQAQHPVVIVLPAGGEEVTVARVTPPESRPE